MSIALWLAQRQARESLKAGNPDAAYKVLESFVNDGYKRAIKMLPDVVRGYCARAQRALQENNIEAAWTQLLNAAKFNVEVPELQALRVTLANLGAAQCRALLLAGKPVPVLETLARHKERGLDLPDFKFYENICQEWLSASEQADRGDFAAALGSIQRAKQFVTEDLATGFDLFRQQIEDRYQQYQAMSTELFAATEQRRWGEVLRYCEKVISVAPEHRDVRLLSSRAWQMLQGQPDGYDLLPKSERVVELAWMGTADGGGLLSPSSANYAVTKSYIKDALPIASRAGGSKRSEVELADGRQSLLRSQDEAGPQRFVLWVDGVGGFLVCMGQRVSLGQATGQLPVDVPLHADVSRLHAEITRDAEGYTLESGRDLLVNGHSTKRTALAHGDRITLGATCQFMFQLPVPISPTASLELVSGHRLPVAVDAVLLMAENLIIGPTAPVHILLPGAAANVVLYRGKAGLSIRYPGAFKIDQQSHKDRAALPVPCSVSTESFGFALEPIGLQVK